MPNAMRTFCVSISFFLLNFSAAMVVEGGGVEFSISTSPSPSPFWSGSPLTAWAKVLRQGGITRAGTAFAAFVFVGWSPMGFGSPAGLSLPHARHRTMWSLWCGVPQRAQNQRALLGACW